MASLNKSLIIDKMIVIDDKGMPVAPTVRQLIDKDVRLLYTRDKSKNKEEYVKECIVVYYLGDPKSPANQAGLTQPEALKMAIEQAGLPKDYIPDVLVLRLIKRYYEQNITEAGKTVENIIQAIHNSNLIIGKINTLLNEKIHGELTLEELPNYINMVDAVKKQAGEMPNVLSKLKDALDNYMNERETEVGRGGVQVTASMDAELADNF